MDIKKLADDFIEECNIFSLVSAKEGGVIELNSILEDFFKKEAKNMIVKYDEFVDEHITDNKSCEHADCRTCDPQIFLNKYFDPTEK